MADQPEALRLNIAGEQSYENGSQVILGGQEMISGGLPPYSVAWMKNSEVISTDAQIIVVPSGNETYTLTVTDSRQCIQSKDIALVNQSVTDLEDVHKDGIAVYPNPAQNYIRFELPSGMNIFTAALYNLSGELIWKNKVENSFMLPLNCPPGYYLLKLTSEKVEIIRKLIVL